MSRGRKRTLDRIDEALPDARARTRARTATLMAIPSTEAQNEFGRVLDLAAADQDIAITRHNVVRAVLVSAARYRELIGREAAGLDDLASRFDELYASMQTGPVREATARAVRAAPEEMGRAAVTAARRARDRRAQG
jgi:prevent-host-death family protein